MSATPLTPEQQKALDEELAQRRREAHAAVEMGWGLVKMFSNAVNDPAGTGKRVLRALLGDEDKKKKE